MLQRLLVDRIENRILLGTVAFVGIMLLVGWVAINENARMASFERQYEARAIERGAKLFAANCSTCHGTDGRGLAGRAPGLNSPHFFGYDFFAEVNAREKALKDEQFALSVQLVENPDAADNAERTVRLTEIATELDTVATDRQNVQNQLAAAFNAGYPLNDEVARQGRLAQLGWTSTQEAFIITTLIHGRPVSGAYWPQPMAAWSQRAGGPLRDDQIADIASYIMNFDKGDAWTVEDALLVSQYPIVPGIGGNDVETVGTDTAAIVTAIAEVQGDAANGEELYFSRKSPETILALGCSGCHAGAASAPDTAGTWDRVVSERLAQPEFTGYTAEQYLVESIVLPHQYLVPPYGAVMPADFGDRLTTQELADIIAYLRTTGANASVPASN